jgi:hypothetical protein
VELKQLVVAVATSVRADKAATANAATHATTTTTTTETTTTTATTREADAILLQAILSVFDGAILEVLRLLQQNSYVRFRGSSVFKKLVTDLENNNNHVAGGGIDIQPPRGSLMISTGGSPVMHAWGSAPASRQGGGLHSNPSQIHSENTLGTPHSGNTNTTTTPVGGSSKLTINVGTSLLGGHTTTSNASMKSTPGSPPNAMKIPSPLPMPPSLVVLGSVAMSSSSFVPTTNLPGGGASQHTLPPPSLPSPNHHHQQRPLMIRDVLASKATTAPTASSTDTPPNADRV